MTRVVLLNVKYSPNLGDGLLSECLERELLRNLPAGSSVESVDLAGRRRYDGSAGRGRAGIMAILDSLPPMLRRVTSELMLRLLVLARLNRHYRAGLGNADVAIVGGGNLFSDADLNFPSKIAAALRQAARRRIPVLVHAVGVSPTWSNRGRQLFAHGLARCGLVAATVRDERSRTAWADHLGPKGLTGASVVVDPGVLASLHYPRAANEPDRRVIAFCITDPLAVRYHSAETATADLGAWYADAISSLACRNFEVVLFTNGSPEDRNYLWQNAAEWIRLAKGPVSVGRSFATPADLAAFVSGCSAIVAHRMHACIAAYSFGVPAVGLAWDVKLESFFDLSGRRAHLLHPEKVAGAELADRVERAIADPLDPSPLVAQARAEISDLASRLVQLGSKHGHG